MYKVDNKNQKAKIKNLEQRLDFQKYNIKEKKQKEKRKKRTKQENKQKKTQKTKSQELLKTPTTTTQRLYIVFALKKMESIF